MGIRDTPIQVAVTVTPAAMRTQAEVTQAAVEVTQVAVEVTTAADEAITADEGTMEAVDTTAAASDSASTGDLTRTVLAITLPATAILPATTIRMVIGIPTRAAQGMGVTKAMRGYKQVVGLVALRVSKGTSMVFSGRTSAKPARQL